MNPRKAIATGEGLLEGVVAFGIKRMVLPKPKAGATEAGLSTRQELRQRLSPNREEAGENNTSLFFLLPSDFLSCLLVQDSVRSQIAKEIR